MAERRLHARLTIDLPCTLESLGHAEPARLRELSLGGALVTAAPGALAIGGACIVEVAVPGWPGPFSFAGRAVRRDVHGEENTATFGIRLDGADDPSVRENLAGVLDMLMHLPGPGTRRHVRMDWRADVLCKSAREFNALLSNVSRGGLALTTSRRIAVGEKITVEIRVRDLQPVAFPTHVVHVSEKGTAVWQVGVEFEALDAVAQAKLDEFLRRTIRGR